MNRWLFLAVSAMTLATVSLSAYCKSCGSRSDKGSHYYNNSRSYGHGGMKTFYTKNSNYRDRQDDKYMTEDDRYALVEIHKALDEQGFDWDDNNVQTTIEYGKVVFTGRVDTEQEKEVLREVAAATPYVRNVVVDVYVDDIDPDHPSQPMPNMPNNFNH